MGESVISRALGLLLFAACAAGAAQFHIPVRLTPRPLPADAEEGPTAWFGAGAAAARGPGMSLDGPGGFWELAWRAGRRGEVHVRGDGFILKGSLDPFGAGRRRTHGFAGSLAVDYLRAPESGGRLRYFAGIQAGLTALDVRDPIALTAGPGGAIRVEPGTAVSLVPSVPAGAIAWTRAGRWILEASGDASPQLGGATFFTYGPGGPSAYDSTRTIHFDLGGGARLRAHYEPWSLSLELAGRATAGFGGNDPVSWGAVLLTLGAL